MDGQVKRGGGGGESRILSDQWVDESVDGLGISR